MVMTIAWYSVGQVCNIGDITTLLLELIKPDQGDGYDHCLPQRYSVEQVCNIGDIAMLFCVVQSSFHTKQMTKLKKCSSAWIHITNNR